MDTTPFWAGEAERAAELGAARAEGAAEERERLVAALNAVDRRALAARVVWRDNITDLITDITGELTADIEAGRL